MTQYRRWRRQGATYYFETCLENPAGTLLCDHIDALSLAWARTARDLPFVTDAVVVLPHVIHTIWTLPDGDHDYSERWRLIKYRFSRMIDQTGWPCDSKRRKRERGLWQRRFWEHEIRTGHDLARHRRLCENWKTRIETGIARDEWPFAALRPCDSALGLPFAETDRAVLTLRPRTGLRASPA